jgi:hypothetical protein
VWSSGIVTTAPAVQRLAACAALVLASACAPKSPETEPRGGTITVGVVATGPGVKDLTFQLKIQDTGVTKPIGADAGVASLRVGAGEHRLVLDVPGRCNVEGGPERRVVVIEKGVTPVRYTVTCK